MEYAMTLFGRIPSKKNSKRIVRRGASVFLLPSEQHQQWREEQLWYLMTLKDRPKNLDDVTMDITIYAPDKRIADLTNKVESIMDLFVDAEIIKDDSWFIVKELKLYFGGVKKDNPRADIVLHF